MAAPIKKKPQRTCVVCKTKRDKKDLMRVVLTPEGEILFDPTGRAAGRGAYLCRNEECITAELKKSGKIAKACGGFVFRRGKISFWVKDFTKFRGLELCHQPVVNLPKATLGARIGRTKGIII